MIEIVLLSYKYNIIKIKQQRKGFYFMKKTGRRFLAFMLILRVLVYSQAVFAYDFSGAQPKTVALEGVSGYAPYGGTAKIGLTWSTNDPAKLVGGLFNLIKKNGSDIPDKSAEKIVKTAKDTGAAVSGSFILDNKSSL